MKILITGASGFIGAHCARVLAISGHELYCIDNYSDYYSVELKEKRVESLLQPLHINVERLDLNEVTNVRKIINQFKPDTVLHLAAQAGVRIPIAESGKYISSNLSGFGNVFIESIAFGVSNFLYASSSSVYGNGAQPPYVETELVLEPTSFYGATKLANEKLAFSMRNVSGTKIRGLRFFTVYGPWGRPDMAYFRIIDSILNDKKFELYGDGSTKRDFTFIDDTVQCVVKLINDLDNKGKSFNDLVNIGGGSPKSMSDLMHEIELISRKKLKVSQEERFNGDAMLTVSDDSYLKELIGFSPRIAIADGMREVFQWAENPNVRSELSKWVESTK